eukprot:TRINITY_DN50903_c0_g1_i1.p1 TRINITY_DN50903_c0_g1~~TRINITY_DN50903_c0_g1_i1.p1  ORF type:complete len:330 (-),score=59.84 TRINITY_DN50903_c0_g1_i1:28-885(-)
MVCRKGGRSRGTGLAAAIAGSSAAAALLAVAPAFVTECGRLPAAGGRESNALVDGRPDFQGFQAGHHDASLDVMRHLRGRLHREASTKDLPGMQESDTGASEMKTMRKTGKTIFDTLFGAGDSNTTATPPPPPTDKFITDRFPLLQTYKVPLMAALHAFAFYMGWVGQWGMVFGVQARSYFDLLAIPLRVFPSSPWCGSPLVVTQFYANLILFRLPKFLKRVADGSFLVEMKEKAAGVKDKAAGARLPLIPKGVPKEKVPYFMAAGATGGLLAVVVFVCGVAFAV